MNFTKIAVSTTLASALMALTGASVAATDPSFSSSRQERMDAAYENYRSGKSTDANAHQERSSDLGATGNVREDARRFGKGMKRGAKHTGKAIAHGAREAGHDIADGTRAAGHAIADGARKTGHAVRDAGKSAKDAVTGK